MTTIIVALLLTLLIEVPLAFVLGYRNKKGMISIFAINLLTNPLLNLLVFANSISLKIDFNLIVLLLEIIVVITEWQLLAFLLKEDYPQKKFLLDSIILNVTSCLTGLILFQLF